jgi:hypothetical protein
MAAPDGRPCLPWADDLDECCQAGGACRGSIPDGYDPDDVLDFATYVVWALSGRRFGLCSTTVRPCTRKCIDQMALTGWLEWTWPFPSVPVRDSVGRWINLSCGCRTSCTCLGTAEFQIPRGPVASIDRIKVDGVVLTGGIDYRLDNHRRLVRLGGEQWPLTQNLLADDSQPGTWSIAWTYGRRPPTAGVKAVQSMACELAKACVGGPCSLPRRVTNITRQGTSLTLLDPMDFIDKGRTGITEVDLFLVAANPDKLKTRARIYRADAPSRGRRPG